MLLQSELGTLLLQCGNVLLMGGLCAGGCAGWTHKVDDNLSKKICEHSVGLEAAEFSQYHAELHKKDYSWQEREDRKNKGRKRPAEDANVPAEDANDTENVDAGVGDGSDGEEK